MLRTNPFATRHIRPGALAYLFPPGESAQAVVDRLRASGWRGQIIGPHGSGKSTLMAAIVPALEAAGRKVELRPIKANTKDFDSLPPEMTADTQLVMDGYEQLSWWTRRRIEAKCRRHQTGLLITAHRDLGLPTLLATQPTLSLAQQVVAQLLGPEDQTILLADVAAAWEAAGGNLRETLFKLYDVYQARRP
jgi:ABC-type hemin transport system ATPase subunit